MDFFARYQPEQCQFAGTWSIGKLVFLDRCGNLILSCSVKQEKCRFVCSDGKGCIYIVIPSHLVIYYHCAYVYIHTL